MFCFVFDLAMAGSMLLIGYLFYRSNGRGANYLSGYQIRSKAERRKYDERAMCRLYGKHMMAMAIPFLLGAVIDLHAEGIGCLFAWLIWLVMFVRLMRTRKQVEA